MRKTAEGGAPLKFAVDEDIFPRAPVKGGKNLECNNAGLPFKGWDRGTNFDATSRVTRKYGS